VSQSSTAKTSFIRGGYIYLNDLIETSLRFFYLFFFFLEKSVWQIYVQIRAG